VEIVENTLLEVVLQGDETPSRDYKYGKERDMMYLFL